MRFHVTLSSNNEKTGPIPVTTSSSDTCPPNCPLKGSGCYAEHGPLRLWWRKINSGEYGYGWDAFLELIRSFPSRQLWRYAQAGDLPGKGNAINVRMLRQLIKVNRGKRGFTYTHKPLTKRNRLAIEEANREGFTINLSANNLDHAVELMALGVGPVATLVPLGSEPKFTHAGRRVVVCPSYTTKTTCLQCGICANAGRKTIIGLPPHGSRKRKVNDIARASR